MGRAMRFYYPLALSWFCMAAESPICLAVISRSPNAEVNTAAFLMVMAVAIFIESPVIDLLSTSTTLGRTRQNVEQIKRFAWILMVLVTVVHAAVVWTPLYDVVVQGILGQKPEVAAASLWPLRILTLWSAFIGWRRALQGLLIRNGETKAISVGTLIRVGTIAAVAFSLHFATKWDGLVVASIALLASVVAESLFIHAISRSIIREKYHEEVREGPPLGLSALAAFHLPLTGATVVTLITGPIMSRALAVSEEPIANAAAYQLALSLLWLFRTATFALPEVVIALNNSPGDGKVLWRFSAWVGGVLSLAILVVWGLGGDAWWFAVVLRAEAHLIPLASLALILGAALPFVNALMCCLRGYLTSARVTWARLLAIGAAVGVLFAALQAGAWLSVPGIWKVSLAALLAQGAELAVLAWSWQKTQTKT